MQGTWVQCPVGGLRAHMLFSMAENRLLGSEIAISNHSTAPLPMTALMAPWSQTLLPIAPSYVREASWSQTLLPIAPTYVREASLCSCT